MFEQNNVGVRLDNPCEQYVKDAIGRNDETELRSLLATVLAIAAKVDEEGEEGKLVYGCGCFIVCVVLTLRWLHCRGSAS